MPTFKTALLEALGIAIGEASMCWSETPKGIFDSSKADRIAKDLAKFILDAYNTK